MSQTIENRKLCLHVTVDNKPVTLQKNWTNGNGEAQIFIYMSDLTSLCVTHVTHNLRPYNAYYTVKHHANEADVIAQKYRATNHEKCSFTYPTLEQLEAGLTRYLNKIRSEDNVIIIRDQEGIYFRD